MIDQAVFNWAVALAGFMGGWILKVIWDSIKDLQKSLAEMDVKMHRDFVQRSDFKDAMAGMHDEMLELKVDMKDGFKEVKEMLTMLNGRIESKADK